MKAETTVKTCNKARQSGKSRSALGFAVGKNFDFSDGRLLWLSRVLRSHSFCAKTNRFFRKRLGLGRKDFVPYAGVVFFIVPVRLLMLSYQRVYRLQGAFSYIAEFIKIFKAVAVGSLLTIAFTFLFRGGFAFRDFPYSRGVFALDFALALVAFTIFHLGLRYVQTIFRKRDINLIPTLIVGTNAEAEQTIRELKERRDLGYRVVGIIATRAQSSTAEENKKSLRNSVPQWLKLSWRKCPIVGNLDDLPEIIRELEIQEVIITDNTIPSDMLFEAMMQIGRKQKVEFRLAPSLFNFLPQKTSVEQIGVLPMVRLFREPLSDAENSSNALRTL